jgi:translation initiation factor 5B
MSAKKSTKINTKAKLVALIKKQQEDEKLRLENEQIMRDTEAEIIKQEEEDLIKKKQKVHIKELECRANQKILAKKMKEDQANLKKIETILKIPGAKLPPSLLNLYNEYDKKGMLNKLIYVPPLKLQSVEIEEEIDSEINLELRSPICCVLGHVDTGKTLLLDKMRKSNVQKGEAGGITQQIGATFFPLESIKNLTRELNQSLNLKFLVPGLLIIDTPGHDAFTNLRDRGSSLCDIVILVVDITAGFEQQTIESLDIIRKRKIPFVIALNKVDKIFEWIATPNLAIQQSLANQKISVVNKFNDYVRNIQCSLSKQGFNSDLYYKNKDFRKCVSIVPTSAVTSEGIPDLLMLLVQLTQKILRNNLSISDNVKCTVLEVKKIEGLGTTIDCIISDGKLCEQDKIILCGTNGPIITKIQSILVIPPLREIRLKANSKYPYVRTKEIKASMGIKIVATDLNNVVAGSQLYVIRPGDNVEQMMVDTQNDYATIIASVSKVSRGIHVQASTIGSIEALLLFLSNSKIPVASIAIGTVHKKDVTRASIMLNHDIKYGVILAFDVQIDKEAETLAKNLGVRIFSAAIIYHLKDMYDVFVSDIEESERKKYLSETVWPCVLQIIPECIFTRNPLMCGVKIIAGTLHIGTPICAIKEQDNLYIGTVTSIEDNGIRKDFASAGSNVSIKISTDSDKNYIYKRHFDHTNILMSNITRQSIDCLKDFFATQLTPQDIDLLKKMKLIYQIA